MALPKFSPLQSRFAATVIASAVLLFLYVSLSRPQFAYAFDLDSRIPPDHNHPIIDVNADYIQFEENDNSWLEPRAANGASALANNAPQNMNINQGEIQTWVVPMEVIDGPHGQVGTGLPGQLEEEQVEPAVRELRKRQTNKQVYITVTTCLQPEANGIDLASDAAIPPQLELFVSLSAENQSPRPDSGRSDQQQITADGGYVQALLNPNADLYFSIVAPNTSTFSGIWNYEVAASIDAPYHGSNGTWSNLYFVDGDNHAALLITNDTTQANTNETVYQEWMSLNPPFGLFAHNHNDRSILGVKNSYCGLMNNAKILANFPNVNNQNVAKMTNRGLGGKPKEQFYITGLNQSSNYWGFLAMDGNSTSSGIGVVGGGGTVWAAINFTTKTDNNCALMYNLSFCSEVAYAVPTNPEHFSPSTGLPELAALYDSYAARMYQYFNYSLQQIPCKTTSSAQYSLARNCDDCARAYKQWLCAVTIPRCSDFSNTDPWLKPRNLGQNFVNGSSISASSLSDFGLDQALLNQVASNSSRNPIIDQNIQPGPYKEVLPCEDLCYDLVQSCPAALGFGCPLPRKGLEDSYGRRSNNSGVITCSYLGAAYYLSAGGRVMPDWTMILMIPTWISLLFVVFL